MGVSKLPIDVKPERWQLLFYVVRLKQNSFRWSGELTLRDSWEA